MPRQSHLWVYGLVRTRGEPCAPDWGCCAPLWRLVLPASQLIGARPSITPHGKSRSSFVSCRRKRRDRRAAACGATVGGAGAARHHREPPGRRRRHGLYSVPHMLVVHPALPVDSMERLVSYAKANPGKVSYAHPGFGTQPHLLAELFRLTTGTNIVQVPYKGATPAVTDILAGQVQMYFDSVALFLAHIQVGNLRALAVADDNRNDLLPGVPTTAESGFPDLLGAFWACVAAPAGTPEDIINRLNQLINRVLQSPEIEASLAKFGAKQRSGSPQDLAALWKRETQKWSKIISAAGIKAD